MAASSQKAAGEKVTSAKSHRDEEGLGRSRGWNPPRVEGKMLEGRKERRKLGGRGGREGVRRDRIKEGRKHRQ